MSLAVEKLKVTSGGFTIAVDSLRVSPGHICAVMGRSGAGKTTLLHAIAGFLPLDEGAVLVRGERVDTLPPERRRTAMVFQHGALFPHLTVAQNIEFPLRFQKLSPRERSLRVGDWLDRLEIAPLSARLPHQLSGGQAQRVSLGRALITGFPALLLDEPFSALDTTARGQLREVVRKLVSEAKVAALLVTHDPEDARSLADHIVMLDEGNVTWAGTAAAFGSQNAGF